MRDYFRPLRRKMGVVTLVLAGVLSVGWIRSLSIADSLALTKFGTDYQLMSIEGGFEYTANPSTKINRPIYWRSELAAQVRELLIVKAKLETLKSELRRLAGQPAPARERIQTVPYWSVTLPLTVFSAYLLLSKPRSKPASAYLPSQLPSGEPT